MNKNSEMHTNLEAPQIFPEATRATQPEANQPAAVRADGYLERDGHRIYWLEAGAADGPPLLILPAGPGAGHARWARSVFSPRSRMLQIDPRGCGKSEPAGALNANTTAHLVEDLEAFRTARGVDRWVIVGHLWGAALGLAYAQAYPDRCTGLVVASVYLGDRADRDWFFGGIACMLPAEWDELLGYLPQAERRDPLAALKTRIDDPDPGVHRPAAAALMKYDRAIVRFWPGTIPADAELTAGDIHFLRVFLHFLAHDFFLADSLLQNLHRVRHIPTTIVQGRFDVASGMRPAFRLAQAWPEAVFIDPRGGCSYAAEPMSAAVRDAVHQRLGI